MHSSIKLLLIAAIASTAFTGMAAAQSAQVQRPAPVLAPLQPNAAVPPAPVSGAAQIPQQPAGGMDTPPTVGNEDPAMRQNLNGADEYVDTMQGAANSRLQGLIGNSSNAGASGSELEEMMRIRRSNLLLGLKREEADLAVGLWGALFNNEHAQAWRDREASEQERIREEQQEANAAAAAQAAVVTQQGSPTVKPMPVVYEIINGTATILAPGSGELYARVGTILPNGMKVVSIGSTVVVEDEGKQFSLGFGTQTSTPAAPNPGLAGTTATPLLMMN